MLAQKYLCREQCYFSCRSSWDQNDIKQPITEIRIRCNWQSTGNEAAVSNNDVIKVDRQSFFVIEYEVSAVCVQLGQRRGRAANVSERSPSTFDLRRQFFIDNPAEAAGGDVDEITCAIAFYAHEIDRRRLCGTQDVDILVDRRWQPK